MSNWVDTETEKTTINDRRLNTRLKKLLNAVSQQPTESLPAVTNGWSETLAAYRFLDNKKVCFDTILAGHREATIERIRQQPVVLILQDTTFLNYGQAEKVGYGTLRKTKSEHYLLHPSVAFTPSRVNLGVLGAKFWQRPDKPEGWHRRKVPIEEKESYRWLESYADSCTVQSACPDTLIVNIADREGDIHDWFMDAEQRPMDEKAEYIVRAKCNRRTCNNDETGYLWNELTESKSLGKLTIVTPRQKNRKSREVTLTLHAKQLEFAGARQGQAERPTTVYAVFAKEKKPPKGEKPIEWMLLTSLPVDTLTQAQTIIGWYRCRWEIEIYFRALKQGCAVENLRLETDRRLLNCIAIYMIVAWRIQLITMQSRALPAESCEVIFTKKEWQTIFIMQNKSKPPNKAPALNEITRLLAQLGGFLARKHDGDPGIKNIWRGYTRLLAYMEAFEVMENLK